MDHQYWVYIVASNSGTLYIGFTNNLERRVREHNSGEFEGFASTYRCDRLVYYESFQDVLRAIDREKQLKRWRRSKKLALIDRAIPTGTTWPSTGDGSWPCATKAFVVRMPDKPVAEMPHRCASENAGKGARATRTRFKFQVSSRRGRWRKCLFSTRDTANDNGLPRLARTALARDDQHVSSFTFQVSREQLCGGHVKRET